MRNGVLIWRTLCYFRRSSLVVAAGVAVATAVLAGALMVGDSMTASLGDLVDQRLGRTDHLLHSPMFFPQSLSGRLAAQDGFAADFQNASSAILTRGSLYIDKVRSPGVRVIGVDAREFAVPRNRCVLSAALAEDLDVAAGDEVALRVVAETDVPRDLALGSRDADIRLVRLTVHRVAAEAGVWSRFSLNASQRVPRNCWMNLAQLAELIDRTGRANMIWVSAKPHAIDPQSAGRLNSLLQAVATPGDYGLRFRKAVEPGVVALESRRIFLPPGLVAAARRAAGKVGFRITAVSTNLANSIERVDASGKVIAKIPYSMVSGLDPAPGGALADDAIILNQWAADDLAVRDGDRIRLRFYRRNDSGELIETGEDAIFRFRRSIPSAGIGVDASLTPWFEGVTDSLTVGSWDPPSDLKIDHSRLRPKDETYWESHKAAPKAFISLAAARRLWGSTLGGLTGLRLPKTGKAAFIAALRTELRPESMGLSFRPVRFEQRLSAGGSTDFGVLFVSFSFFLIVSATMLVGLLFRLSIERRSRQIGLMRAVGFSPVRVLGQQVAAGMILAVLGAAAGVAGAIGYAGLMVHGLNTWWAGSIGGGFLRLHIIPATLVIGFVSGVVVSALAILWAVWRLRRDTAIGLLSGGRAAIRTLRRRRHLGGMLTACICLAIAAVLIVQGLMGGPVPGAAAFFIGGVLLLVAALAGLKMLLAAGGRAGIAISGPMPVIALGVRNAGRNVGRNVLTAGLIASAAFIIVTVAVMRKGAPADTHERDSGAGGYTMIVEADLPLLFSPATAAGRERLAMDSRNEAVWDRVHVEALRVTDGEDVSCLNLCRPTRPRIAAVPNSMIRRGGFRFATVEGEAGSPWELLRQARADGQVPIFADAATAEWTLHMSLGETLEITDEAGRTIQLRLVGLLAAGSIFQGELLMGEANFRRHFPSVAGFRVLLIAADAGDQGSIKRVIEGDTSFTDFGVAVDATADRLAAFAAVEGTYMSTFQSLGSLGLLLGSVGVAVVLLRGLDERRRELALLASLGFRRGRLMGLIVSENAFPLTAGLVCGAASALVAGLPQILTADSNVNWIEVVLTLGFLPAAGLAVLLAAAAAGLRIHPARDLHAE